MSDAAWPPLYVVALGGNVISPPQGDLSFGTERVIIDVFRSPPGAAVPHKPVLG